MDNRILTQFSTTNSIDENECTTPYLIPIDKDVNEFSWHDKSLMPDPYVGEELSEESISKAMEHFVREFTNRYPTSGPPLYIGTLDQALAHSLFNPTNPQPLILFIYHSRSVSTNVFCQGVLCTEEITNYLDQNFIVWAWDRTNKINYERLLTMLRSYLGDAVAKTVASSPIDKYPMLIGLMFNKGNVKIINIIEGPMTSDETFIRLIEARDKFDRRDEKPDQTNLSLRPVSNEGWSMSPSVLISIYRRSREFERIACQYVGATDQVTSIDEIENTLWLFQYLNLKKTIDNRLKGDTSEQLLVFPCLQSIAEEILRNGFNDSHKSRESRNYGHGFYFSSPPVYKHCYTPKNSSNRNTVLVCRVLVGRTCLGNLMMETCPRDYDSTTDGSNTYVVYSNRSILPKYYIQY